MHGAKRKDGSIALVARIVKRGPKPGENRLSTRLACILTCIGKCAPGKAVPLDLDALAVTLRCKRETVRKLLLRLRVRAWFFQGYHTVIFLTHEGTEDAPKGIWRFYVANRHSLHRIWAKPGAGRQLRWHARKGSDDAWVEYLRRIKLLALAMIFRGKKGRHGKHKGFSHDESGARAGGARAPNKSRGLRRFGKLAFRLQCRFDGIDQAPQARIVGWACNRLGENHAQERIYECLTHAVRVLRKTRQTRPDNSASWVCHVANWHLQSDGLLPSQRLRERKRQEGTALRADI